MRVPALVCATLFVYVVVVPALVAAASRAGLILVGARCPCAVTARRLCAYPPPGCAPLHVYVVVVRALVAVASRAGPVLVGARGPRAAAALRPRGYPPPAVSHCTFSLLSCMRSWLLSPARA